MKRDLDLVRRVLIDLETRRGSSEGASGWGDFIEEGYELSEIHEHIQLMHDAGLIHADEIVPGQWWPERLTWAGHEFLDAARNEALWSEARLRVERTVGSAPFEVVRELLAQLAKEKISRPNRRTRRK